MDLFIDAEWYISQKIFLIGFAHCDHHIKKPVACKQLYGKAINKANVMEMLKPAKNGYIFFYGPDIGMLEKSFKIDIRIKYSCVNLLKVFKYFYPNRSGYRLCHMEEMFGYERETMKYKQSIFEVFHDWHDPIKREIVLKYNREDVVSLAEIKKRAWKNKRITSEYLEEIRLR